MLSIVGIVLAGIGVYLLIHRKKSLHKILEIKSTKTSTTAELLALQKAVADEIGPGGFNQLAEVKGVVECAAPLTAELSEQPCVWYSMSVQERYEETYQERDAEGRTRTGTRTATTTVANNTQAVPFLIRDETGIIAVQPNHAAIDGRQIIDRHEPWSGNTDALSVGSFRLAQPRRNHRVLGYQYTEEIIPVGAPVYIIGEATDREGTPVIGNPADTEQPFIISLRSEEEVTKGLESKAKTEMIVGILLIAGGILLAVFGLG